MWGAVARMLAWLVAIAWPLIKDLLLKLGIAWVSYEGIGAMVDQIDSMFRSNIGILGQTVVNVLGVMNADIAFNMVLSAVTARIVVSGLTSGRLTFRKR